MKRSASRLRPRSASSSGTARTLYPGNVDQIRAREMQIIAGDAPRKIVAPAEGEAEAIEAVRDEVRKVVAPIVAVVEPALILDIADECAVDASDAVSGLFLERRSERECVHGIGRVTYAVGKLGDGVHQAAVIGGGGAHGPLTADLFRCETEAFRG